VQYHPNDVRGKRRLAIAYGNASLVVDSRQSHQTILERRIAMQRKSVAVNEALLADSPDLPVNQLNLAESRVNLGNTLVDAGQYRDAIVELRKASPVLAARAADTKDARAGLNSVMNDLALAWALFKSDAVDEAEPMLVALERRLRELLTRYEHVEAKFAMARVQAYLGMLYVARAQTAAPRSAASLNFWRKARAQLAPGLAALREIHKLFPEDTEAEVMIKESEAALARADEAIAAFGAGR
jgi:tetratricopeptide (TPR) repeat protein